MFDKIKKIFKNKTFTKKEKNFLFYPNRDWKILFLVFLTINLAAFFYIAVFYWGINKEKDFEEPLAQVETKFIDEELLDNVLEIYIVKEKKLNELMESPPATSDPSI